MLFTSYVFFVIINIQYLKLWIHVAWWSSIGNDWTMILNLRTTLSWLVEYTAYRAIYFRMYIWKVILFSRHKNLILFKLNKFKMIIQWNFKMFAESLNKADANFKKINKLTISFLCVLLWNLERILISPSKNTLILTLSVVKSC